MSGVAIGTGVLALGVGVTSAVISANASKNAANKQAGAANAGIQQTKQQFAATRRLFEPFVKGGADAFEAQKRLMGIGGLNQTEQAMLDAPVQRWEDLSDRQRARIMGGSEDAGRASYEKHAVGLAARAAYEKAGGGKGPSWDELPQKTKMSWIKSSKLKPAAWEELTDEERAKWVGKPRFESEEAARADWEARMGERDQRNQGLADKQRNAQQEEIDALVNSPMFQALAQQGETGILQNASATGGLRGGNTQGLLAQFRPQLLQQFIEQRMAQLGNLAGMGQASAAGQAAAGQNYASNISGLLEQLGAAQAGNALAQGQAWQQPINTLSNLGGTFAGFKLGAGGGINPGAGGAGGGGKVF